MLASHPHTTTTACSFSDLELTGSGSATSWLGCDLLMDVEEEEYRWGLLGRAVPASWLCSQHACDHPQQPGACLG